MPTLSLRNLSGNRLRAGLVALLAVLGTVLTAVLPANPAKAEYGISCGWVQSDGWRNCTTYLRGDNEIPNIDPYFAWVNIGDRVDYRKEATTTYTGRIRVSGNAQTCSGKGVTSEKPKKVTMVETYSFATAGFGFTVSPSGVEGSIEISGNGTQVTITNVLENTNCIQHGYALEFMPTGLGLVLSMSHNVTTTFDWGTARGPLTVGTYDITRFPSR